MRARWIIALAVAVLGASCVDYTGLGSDSIDYTKVGNTGAGASGAGGASGSTSSNVGPGGAAPVGTGGDMTVGAGGDVTVGAGGAPGAGGAGGSLGQGGAGGMPPLLSKPSFLYWGDFATDGTYEFASVHFPNGIPKKIPMPGVTKIDQTYEIAQSRDGKLLALAFRADAGKAKVYVGQADGSGVPIVVADLTTSANTNNSTELTDVSFSPDGKLLAFRTDAAVNGQHLIYVVPTDGSNMTPKLVTPSPSATQEASVSTAWSDNTHLAVVGELGMLDNVFNLYVTDTAAMVPALTPVIDAAMLNSSNKQVKTGVQAGADGKLYFRSSHNNGVAMLYKADANGMNPTIVGAQTMLMGAEITNFQLSPDGLSVAFGANEKTNGNIQIYGAKLVDMTATKLTAFTMIPAVGQFYGPSTSLNSMGWSPDGMLLAVVADWRLAVMDADDDYVAFVLPTTGNPAPVRVANVASPGLILDVEALGFTADSLRLGILGDLLVNNDTEFYATADLTTANQPLPALRIQGVLAGSDVDDFLALR